jgi:5'-nucleotidase / UDP-sugar diphosphatase
MFKPLLACFALLSACAHTVGGPHDLIGIANSEPIHLVVLHTNDIHGQAAPRSATWLDRDNPPQLGGLPRLAGEISAMAAAERAAGALVLVLDGGDWYQGTPEGLVDDGVAFTSLLGRVEYDAMVVGNHEFDHGVPHLANMLRETRVPAVMANVREQVACFCAEVAPANCRCGLNPKSGCECALGERVDWAPPFRVVTLQRNSREIDIALVGLITQDTPTITHHDARALDFEDPVLELERVMRELEPLGIEMVVPVTHLGVDQDRLLARAFPALPLIVGGHSHTTLKNGVHEGETLIVQTGCKATVLGRVDLMLDPATLAVLSAEARLIELPVDETRTDVEIAVAAQSLIQAGAEQMNVEVGVLSTDLGRSRGTVSGSAGNWITDIMRARLGSDVAIQNRGGIRSDLTAGVLTRRDLFGIAPFGNTLVEVELTGADLLETAKRATMDTRHSGIEMSGMTVQYAGAWPDGEVVGVRIGGEPVDPTRVYRVATNSFLVGGGDEYFPESIEVAKKLDTGLMLRDLLEEALREGAGERIDTSNRYEVLR